MQVATFSVVPPAYRVRFVAAGNFAWMIWLDQIARLGASRPSLSLEGTVVLAKERS